MIDALMVSDGESTRIWVAEIRAPGPDVLRVLGRWPVGLPEPIFLAPDEARYFRRATIEVIEMPVYEELP